MTLIFEDSLKENQHAKYVDQRSFRSQIIGRTHTHTHTHISSWLLHSDRQNGRKSQTPLRYPASEPARELVR